MSITMKDLEIRNEGLKKTGAPECRFQGCKNTVDHTTMGWDNSCPYHRLLHDYFLYESGGEEIHYNRKDGLSKEEYRKKFSEWVDSIGNEEAARLVLEMANEGINWGC